MAARLWRRTTLASCVTSTGMPAKNAANILKCWQRAQSPLNPFYTWCKMFLTGLHNSPVVSIPSSQHDSEHEFFHTPPSSPSSPSFLTCTRVRAIIIIITRLPSIKKFSKKEKLYGLVHVHLFQISYLCSVAQYYPVYFLPTLFIILS